MFHTLNQGIAAPTNGNETEERYSFTLSFLILNMASLNSKVSKQLRNSYSLFNNESKLD